MSASPTRNDERIAMLENQLKTLRAALSEERTRRKDENDKARSREVQLRSQVRERENSHRAQSPAATTNSSVKKAPMVPRVAKLAHMKPQARELTVGIPPRTADNLFVAVPREKKPPRVAMLKRGARAASEKQRISSLSPKRGGPAGGPGSSLVMPPEEKDTQLQHAWDKFCVRAKDQFTPKELALISPETLQDLLNHYKVNSPVERAQIEAQWALLQEGKFATNDATPRQIKSNRVQVLQRAKHSDPFDNALPLPKPHLSKRTALGGEGVKTSNPNETTSKSGFVRTHSGTVVIRPRTPGRSNPNDTEGWSTGWKPCQRSISAPVPHRKEAHGMMHVAGPVSTEFAPKGIYSAEGSTFHSNQKDKAESVRCNIIMLKNEREHNRGLRTNIDTVVNSPVRTHKPSKIVNTPPHLERATFSTDQLCNRGNRGGYWQKERAGQNLASRTPFAVDYGSANARARQQ